jgi:hypothetical protein
MPHVLRVSAGEVGHPVALLILMKANDGLRFSAIGLIHTRILSERPSARDARDCSLLT